MKSLHVLQRFGERCFLFLLAGWLAVAPSGRAVEPLPFDPSQICRLSVDNIPRSISIRQGADVWLGFDLEKALVFKVWRAEKGKPGIVLKGFKAESFGVALFEQKVAESWHIELNGKRVPLSIRYLGCAENSEHFQLSWEMSYPDGAITLSERVVKTPAGNSSQAPRELRVGALDPGVALELPAAYREAWALKGPDGTSVASFTDSEWHELSLR